jgi:short-subunit dehydrogenase
MKTAVVTGITQGIGRAITKKLLHEGFHVIGCARNERDLAAMAQHWNHSGTVLETHVVDVADRAQLTAFSNAILASGTPVQMLVNNAGVFQPGSIADEPDGQLDAMMTTNLYSAYHLTRALLPSLKAAGPGAHIFNLCSVASLQAYPGGGSYSISKYALLGFSDNLREELKPTGIRVTALCPGATWSRSWAGSGVDSGTIIQAQDIADVLWSAYRLSPTACPERIVIRPQSGDL